MHSTFCINWAQHSDFPALPALFLTPHLHTTPFYLICLTQIRIILFFCLSAHLHPVLSLERRKEKYSEQKNFTLRVAVGLVVYVQGTKALAVPLVTNTSIRQLNLRDNWMGEMGGAAMAKMLKENCCITGSCSGCCLFPGAYITCRTSDVLNTSSQTSCSTCSSDT